MDKKTSDMLAQKRLEAQIRQGQIASKRRSAQESGYVKPQFGVLTSEKRLNDMGFYKREKREYNKKNKKGESQTQEKIEKQRQWLMAVNKMI